MNRWIPPRPMPEPPYVHDLTRWPRHESWMIREAFTDNDGNMSAAARWLAR